MRAVVIYESLTGNTRAAAQLISDAFFERKVPAKLYAVGGYDPCVYVAGSTGVYAVAFYGPSGASNDANGVAKVAPIEIDRLSIGNVEVRNVRAAVMEEGKLDVTLLGMSFLSKLSRVDMRSGRLVLERRQRGLDGAGAPAPRVPEP